MNKMANGIGKMQKYTIKLLILYYWDWFFHSEFEMKMKTIHKFLSYFRIIWLTRIKNKYSKDRKYWNKAQHCTAVYTIHVNLISQFQYFLGCRNFQLINYHDDGNDSA